MPPKKRVSDSAPSPRKRARGTTKIALTILSILALSCECKRVFSELRDLLEPRRRCILPKLLAALHSVRRWRRAGFGGGDNDDMGQLKLTDE
ncbi:hat domain-containing [Pyrenophora seminiperda CCB06]|uniref:Hat domain-containing n=1 Tax=Pyrenophora seminiperda CCB06 TaxID=1302712 RepID=A0A3M7LXG4_9PLEO|nr:hat domain-containing [Pyrenophora seminiperda CCB06]